MGSILFMTLAIMLLFYVPGATGEGIRCEVLDVSMCAFAVSSDGMRCVLERHGRLHGAYVCRTSKAEAEGIKDWVETDDCIHACGLSRSSLGISSDALLDAKFMRRLCSTECYDSCPNIVDLYFNLAAAEGVFLPKLCESQEMETRRAMEEVHVAAGPAGMFAAGPSRFVEAGAPSQM